MTRYTRILVHLQKNELDALRQKAEVDYRTIQDEARYLIRVGLGLRGTAAIAVPEILHSAEIPTGIYVPLGKDEHTALSSMAAERIYETYQKHYVMLRMIARYLICSALEIDIK